MNKISQFEKVSLEQFKKDCKKCFPEYSIEDEDIKNIYNSIKIPQRATAGSAGYDFFLPYNVTIYNKGAIVCDKVNSIKQIVATGIITIPTGIRCKIDQGWSLQIYPRSSLGFKYGLQLANTVGIIDSDYFYSDNEGHIFVKLINEAFLVPYDRGIELKQGQAFCQGIFTPYGITYDDNAQGVRNGGFGSTDNT